MKVVFVIRSKEGYKEVTKEEYDNFDGEKFCASPWWRQDIVAAWLLQLRY